MRLRTFEARVLRVQLCLQEAIWRLCAHSLPGLPSPVVTATWRPAALPQSHGLRARSVQCVYSLAVWVM